jgi:hypothetical protein
VRYESCIGEMRNVYKILVRKILNQETDLGMDGMVILKTILKELFKKVDMIHLAQYKGPVGGS